MSLIKKGPLAHYDSEFDHPPYLREGTSHEAAHSVEDHTPSLRQEVYLRLINCGVYGATDEELATALNLDLNTARPRRWELERDGLIEDSGVRRKTKSGRKAIVWAIVTTQATLL